MKIQDTHSIAFNSPLTDHDEDEEDAPEEDLWFLPGPLEEEADFLTPGPSSGPAEADIVDEWARAEADMAGQLARTASRLGALDERLRRGPPGWAHRLALIEAADLSWFTADRISAERIALWQALRISMAGDDAAALSRIGWAARRLAAGGAPEFGTGDRGVAALCDFLDRRGGVAEAVQEDPTPPASAWPAFLERDPLKDRAGSWLKFMSLGRHLHEITWSCMGFHMWHVAGLSEMDDPLEASVTASKVAVFDSNRTGRAGQGASFAPIAMGGSGGLRGGGDPRARLSRWLAGMESGVFSAMRRIDVIEGWAGLAEERMSCLSGATPPKLRQIFVEWPLVSAPMAESLTGAHRATVQRNIDWMEGQGLLREVTGQGRFRMWTVCGQVNPDGK